MKCGESGQCCPQLLDLIPRVRKQQVQWRENGDESSELELRLGPPGGGEWRNLSIKKNPSGGDESVLYGGYFPNPSNGDHAPPQGNLPSRVVEKKKRNTPAPVVGWPPIRSFRRNLANNSFTKQTPIHPRSATDKPVEPSRKGLFVKINMDGIPIGRKVDLSAYSCYEHLCSAVVELFRGLLAAQAGLPIEIEEKVENEGLVTGLLHGNGDYVLVYEDNEGDSVLVGDVPWQMFVSTVKRLRVIRSSEISSLRAGRRHDGCLGG